LNIHGFVINFAILSDSEQAAASNRQKFPAESPSSSRFPLPEGFAGVLKLVDKPDLGSGAQAYGFESLHPHKCGWQKGFFPEVHQPSAFSFAADEGIS
jgi:hypothetical protein